MSHAAPAEAEDVWSVQIATLAAMNDGYAESVERYDPICAGAMRAVSVTLIQILDRLAETALQGAGDRRSGTDEPAQNHQPQT